MITSHTLMAIREKHEIKQECRHLTRRVWVVLWIVIALLIGWGVRTMTIHRVYGRETRNVARSG